VNNSISDVIYDVTKIGASTTVIRYARVDMLENDQFNPNVTTVEDKNI